MWAHLCWIDEYLEFYIVIIFFSRFEIMMSVCRFIISLDFKGILVFGVQR